MTACSGPFRSSLPFSLHPSRPQLRASFSRFPRTLSMRACPLWHAAPCVSVFTLQTPPKAVPPLPRRSKIPCPPQTDRLACNPSLQPLPLSPVPLCHTPSLCHTRAATPHAPVSTCLPPPPCPRRRAFACPCHTCLKTLSAPPRCTRLCLAPWPTLGHCAATNILGNRATALRPSQACRHVRSTHVPFASPPCTHTTHDFFVGLPCPPACRTLRRQPAKPALRSRALRPRCALFWPRCAFAISLAHALLPC